MDPALERHPYQDHPYYKDHFNTRKPDSWDYNSRILQRIAYLEDRFLSGAVTGKPIKWLFSSEIEFELGNLGSLPEAEQGDMNVYREQVRDKLKGKMQPADVLKDQLGQIDKFNLSDIMMFFIYEELDDLVKYRFGSKEHGIGYYDNPGIGEIRLKPSEPKQFLINYNAAIAKIHDVAKRFDSYTPKIERNHINFSPNHVTGDSLDNMIEVRDGNAETRNQVRHMFAGILKAYADGVMVGDASPQGGYINLGTSRGHMFRIAKNRAEYRAGAGEKDHMANFVLQIIGGAHYGLVTSKKDLAVHKIKMPRIVTAGIFNDRTETPDKPFGQSFYITRTLEGSSLKRGGRLRLPQQYLAINKAKLENELFQTGQSMGAMFFGEDIDLKDKMPRIREVFERITIAKDHSLKIDGDKDAQAELLSNIDCAGTFKTLVSDGYTFTKKEKRWVESLHEFYKNPVNRGVYGDKFIEFMFPRLVGLVFGKVFVIGDKTEPSSLSLASIMNKVEGLLNILPVHQQKRVLTSLIESCERIEKSNNKHIRLMHGSTEEYWVGVLSRREAITRDFIFPLKNVIQDRLDKVKMVPAMAQCSPAFR